MRKRTIIAFSAALMLITASFSGCGNSSDNAAKANFETSVIDATTEIIDETTYITTEDIAELLENAEKEASEDTADTIDVQFPDLSEIGIDTSKFPAEGKKESYNIGDYSQIAFDGESPEIVGYTYESDDGSIFTFSYDGCYYTAPFISEEDYPEMSLSDDEYKAMGEKYLKVIEPDLEGFEPYSFQVDRERRFCNMIMKRTYGCDDLCDTLYINFDGDGRIIEYANKKSNVTDPETAERLHQKAVEYAEDFCKKNSYTLEASEIHGSCMKIDGTVYGDYSFTVNSGTESSPAYGCYSVLVRDD